MDEHREVVLDVRTYVDMGVDGWWVHYSDNYVRHCSDDETRILDRLAQAEDVIRWYAEGSIIHSKPIEHGFKTTYFAEDRARAYFTQEQ